MPWIDSLDWTSLNALRRYPLREGASAISTDGRFALPDTLVVDFSFSATSDVSRRFYISRVVNKINSVIIEISDQYLNVAGTVEANKDTHTQDSDYYVSATDYYVGASGRMTIGVLEDLAQQPAGNFTFSINATEFEARTIIPSLQKIDRIQFVDSSSNSYVLTGDVKIAARTNINFSYAEAPLNRVYMDAGDGLGLNKPCALSNCIQTINGVAPDSSGNISLLGLECLTVSSPTQYTLEFSDTCCTPCSGCNDLETLTTRLTSLENKFIELKNNYNAVNTQLTTYLSTINSNCACPS